MSHASTSSPIHGESEAPLRILQVCSIKGRGGTGYMAYKVCRLLHDAGHAVLLGAVPGSKVAERCARAGIPTLEGLRLRRGFRPWALWRDVGILRRAIREQGVQVLHAWHSIEYWTCALATLGTGAALARTRGLVTPIPAHWANRWIHRRTAAVFVTCSLIEENYRRAGFSMHNVARLEDAVDTARFAPLGDVGARDAIRRELGVPERALLLANVGRLEPVKGQATLLRALAAAPAALADRPLHAVFAGDGSLRESLVREAVALGVAERVHLLGVRSDVERVLQAADLYVLCSVGSEGSSRATLEAMACGLPCITTTVGMLPDLVTPEETGLMTPPGDAPALAAAVQRLAEEPETRARLGAAGLARIHDRHTEAAMTARLAAVYRQALQPA